jgi:hypothetical protein
MIDFSLISQDIYKNLEVVFSILSVFSARLKRLMKKTRNISSVGNTGWFCQFLLVCNESQAAISIEINS